MNIDCQETSPNNSDASFAMAFSAALRRGNEHQDLKDVSLTQIMTFTRLLSVLKNDISLLQPINISPDDAPDFLPPTIAAFASEATGVKLESIPNCWDMLKDDVWSLPRPELSADEEDLFRKHGWKVGIGMTPSGNASTM